MQWIKNQLYFVVERNDGQKTQTTKLHLEHHRLRKLRNLNENSIDRSDFLLKAVGSIERKKKMDIEDNSDKAMDIDNDCNHRTFIKSQKLRRKPPLKNIVKPRDNKGDLRRKWCPVKTCKYHGGKGLVSRKKHLKNHGEYFHLDSPFFKAIKTALEEDQIGWTPCVGCKKLVGFTNSEELCLLCASPDQEAKTIESLANEKETLNYAAEVENIARQKLTLHKGYPHGVSQAFSLALEFCHLAELQAKTDKALESKNSACKN